MKCSARRCRGESMIIYLKQPLCEECWDSLCKAQDFARGEQTE